MYIMYIDELVQERHNSIANALELRLSCTNLSIYDMHIPAVPVASVRCGCLWVLRDRVNTAGV